MNNSDLQSTKRIKAGTCGGSACGQDQTVLIIGGGTLYCELVNNNRQDNLCYTVISLLPVL